VGTLAAMGDAEVTDSRVDVMRAVPAALLTAEGDLDPALRRAAFEHAWAPAAPARLPEPLARFVDKVAREAYKVVDRDVAELRDAGYTEDAILEAVLATAAGAGLSRLDVGLAAVDGHGTTG
jgi:alkylhydroperoxidase family enzyme